MKKLLPAILLLLSFKNHSQSLVLTQAANEPVIGDTSRTYVLDTTAFSSGLMTNVTGSNVVWNYQALGTTTAMIVSAYLTPTAVSSSSAYPGASFVQKQGGTNNFFKSVTSPTAQTEFMGIYSSGISMNFTNTAIFAKYPFSFGGSVTDAFGGTFSAQGQNGTAQGTTTTTADGTGTLNLPGGISFSNVLRVKSMQNINLFLFGFPAGTVQQTLYNFYHGTEKYPLLNINYTTITMANSPTVTASATGHKNYFTVGLEENSLSGASVSIYPNPASDILYLASSEKALSVEIYSQLGQCVYRANFQEMINTSTFSPGIYVVEIKTARGVGRKKLVKE
jgi:hypothetical protein